MGGGSLGLPHLADIDESAHQVLVAERVDSILGLFPSGIFHNSMRILSATVCAYPKTAGREEGRAYPHPYKNPKNTQTRQSNHSIRTREGKINHKRNQPIDYE